MDLTAITLVTFVGLAAVSLALGMAFRGWWASRAAPAESPRPDDQVRLGRLPLARDFVPPTGIVARLDHAFERLLVESAVGTSGLAVTLLLLLAGLGLGGGLFVWGDDVVVGMVGFVMGMFLPFPYLLYRRSSRLRETQGHLADMLDLMARASRAGESLDQAISLVGEKAPEPLGTEFRRCARQLEIGLSLAATMRALVSRLPLMEVRILATTLTVHRQAGGNLAGTLERMARVVRDRLNHRRQIRSVTAAGRFSATLIAAMGPLVFLFLFTFQREYMDKLLTLPLGNILLLVAVGLEIVGVVWVIRLLRTEY